MYLSREIRVRSKFFARSLVLYNFPQCIAACLIAFAIPFLGSVFAALFQPDWEMVLASMDIVPVYRYLGLCLAIYTVMFILDAPLLLGFFSWLSEMTMGRKQKVSYIFTFCTTFKSFIRSIKVSGYFVLLAIAEALKWCVLPFAFILLLENGTLPLDENTTAVLGTAVSLFLLFAVFYAGMLIFCRVPALYLLAAAPEMKIQEGFTQCRDFMYGRKIEIFKLLLSFIPWFFIKRLSYGLTGLFSKPFFYLTLLMFIQQIYNKWLYETGKVDHYIDPLVNLFEEGNPDA